MTPQQYWQEVVSPTVEEYRTDPTSLRRSILSAITIVHFADNLIFNGINTVQGKTFAAARQFFDLITVDCPEAGQLYSLAIVGKHMKQGSNPSPRHTIEDVFKRPPAVLGQAVWGISRWGDEIGGVEFAKNDALRLVEATTAFLKRTFDLQ